jgi:predicted nucleic acid-binding protein
VVKIVIDTYAWIEIFIGSKEGEGAKEILQSAEEIYTPDVVIAEVARKYFREGVSEEVILERLTVMEETSEVISIDKNIAVESAKCYLELVEKAKMRRLKPPSLFDAIMLATAKSLGAKLITGDEHFKEIDETIWIGRHPVLSER